MILLTVAVALVAGLLLLPLIADAGALVVSATRATSKRPEDMDSMPRLLFLIPAHDEEALIGACVSSLVALNYPAHKQEVVVVADNCSDATAAMARIAGARVLERSDEAQPGKPRALDWALGQLPLDEFDAVLIIDADTVVDSNMAEALAENAPLNEKGVQAYCAVDNPGESALTKMAAVLAASRYEFHFPLKDRAGLNVPLLGNGMCIGTEILKRHGWRAFSICEDWELYALITTDGYRIEGNPDARVFAQEARSIREGDSQRQRWAAGKLTVLGKQWPELLRSRRITGLQKLDALAELTHLGPAVHLGLVVLLTGIVYGVQPPGALWLLVGLWASVLRIGLYTLCGLTRMQRPWKTGMAFLYLPFYTVWRLVVQVRSLRLIGGGPWIKTRRNR